MASIATDRGRVSPDRNQRCASYRKLDQVREDAFDATFFFAKCPINASIGCAVKGGGPQRELDPPGNWFAPPGSNQSSSGGNETAEASGVESR